MAKEHAKGEVAVYLRSGNVLTLMRTEIEVETDDEGKLARVQVRPEGGARVLYLDAKEVVAVVATEVKRPGFGG